MAIAITKTKTTTFGVDKVVYGYITFDSSYPTGGEAVSLTALGMSQLRHIQVAGANRLRNRLVAWDGSKTAPKLLVSTALGTEASNTSDQSTCVVDFVAYGA